MIILFLSSFLAWATEAPANSIPKQTVEQVFQKAAVPEVAKDPAKQKDVEVFVDFHALARSSLGKTKVSSKEQAWFESTLTEIITRTVYPKAPDFLKGVSITYKDVDVNGDVATVKSTVQNKADLTDVDYKLSKSKDGQWKVVDVAISGQSWVESIRDQVSDIVKRKKWKGLEDSMNKRLATLRAEKQ